MNMRITNSMLVNNFLNNMNNNLNRMNHLQAQMAANKRIINIYDDPVGVIKSMNARSGLRSLETYSANHNNATTWLADTEDALKSMNEVIKAAYETAVNQSSDPGNDGTTENGASGREAIAPYIQQLRDEVFNIANSRMNGKYLFGGYNTTTQPFTTRMESQMQYTHFYGDVDDLTDPASDNYDESVEVVNAQTGLLRKPILERNPEIDDPEDPDYMIPVYKDVPVLYYNNTDDAATDITYNALAFDPTYDADKQYEASQIIQYDVGFGYRAAINYTGLDLMSVTGVYETSIPDPNSQEEGAEITILEPFQKNIHQIFDDFHNALVNDDQVGIARAVQELQSAQTHIMQTQADVGGRTNRLDIVAERSADDEYLYTKMKSDVEDIDLAEIVMWYSMAESVYNAALYSGGRIIQPSLMDYLR